MYRCKNGQTKHGTWPLVSSPSEAYSDLKVEIPCGQCILCRLNTSLQKTIRLTHEVHSWPTTSFLTLTYDQENLPMTSSDTLPSLPTLTRGQRGHMTLFQKRLRKYLKKPIKMFQCGEYGEKTHRPHHHCILYGHDFSAERTPVVGSPNLFRSVVLDKLWPHGSCVIGNVSWDSASYVASYSVKKLTGKQGAEAYDSLEIVPPYMTSSLGIGREWIENWLYDVYPKDWIAVKGHKVKPPRYYDNVLKRRDPGLYRQVMFKRQKESGIPDDVWNNRYNALQIKEKELEFYRNPTF